MTEEYAPWQMPLFPAPGPAAAEVVDAPRPTGEPPTGVRSDAEGGASAPVEVRISSRRRKTATAFWENGRIVVVLPAHLRGAKRQEMVDWLVARAEARRPHARRSDAELAARAAILADRYVDGVRPSSIRWVTNQSKRWGSCSSATGEIRLSHRLSPVPGWVLDAVVVHELAHLVHADHSRPFHEIVDRYPRQREAALYLEGYALGLEAPS